MLQPTVLCLILACAVSFCTSSAIMESSANLLWAQTYGQPSEMSMKGDSVSPNPWNYIHRMSMYRMMIVYTNPSIPYMGTGTTENPLWGLPVQLDWMLDSGRLADPTGATTCGHQTGNSMCISPQSFFGCLNYFASALPFLSAAHNDIFGTGMKVEMQNPLSLYEYCTTHADCSTKYSDVMAAWDAYFEGVKSTAVFSSPDSVKKDILLGLVWKAQLASVHASSVCSTRYSSYSSVEVAFLQSLGKAIEFTAAASFHPNFLNSVEIITSLPSRVLQNNDILPIDDFTDQQNHALKSFALLKAADELLGGTVVNLWKRAMCSAATREEARELLKDLTIKPNFPVGRVVAILSGMSSSCKGIN